MFTCDGYKGILNSLDLQNLWKKLVEEYQITFLHKESGKVTGYNLRKLVGICLRRKLDKAQQMSYWGNMPLREEQIMAVTRICVVLFTHALLGMHNMTTI